MTPRNRNIKILDRQYYPKGTLIMAQGDHGNRAYVIESGSVEVFGQSEDGEKVNIAQLGKGEIFGEVAILQGGIRSTSVRTLEDTVLIVIAGHDMQRTMAKSPTALNNIMYLAKKRMQETCALLTRDPPKTTSTLSELMRRLRSALEKPDKP